MTHEFLEVWLTVWLIFRFLIDFLIFNDLNRLKNLRINLKIRKIQKNKTRTPGVQVHLWVVVQNQLLAMMHMLYMKILVLSNCKNKILKSSIQSSNSNFLLLNSLYSILYIIVCKLYSDIQIQFSDYYVVYLFNCWAWTWK